MSRPARDGGDGATVPLPPRGLPGGGRVPELRAHAGPVHDPHDLVVLHRRGIDPHLALEEIEGQAVLPAHERAHRALEHGDLVRTVHPVNAKRPGVSRGTAHRLGTGLATGGPGPAPSAGRRGANRPTIGASVHDWTSWRLASASGPLRNYCANVEFGARARTARRASAASPRRV